MRTKKMASKKNQNFKGINTEISAWIDQKVSKYFQIIIYLKLALVLFFLLILVKFLPNAIW